MKILIYGAGVIGSYLTHVLCTAGHEVWLFARDKRKKELAQNGLVIRHYLQKKTTTVYPKLADDQAAGQHYDAVFAVMQYQQMETLLDTLAQADTPLVLLVGNNLSAPEMERYIREHSATRKTVLFGFQGTAGRRENGRLICVRVGSAGLSCGMLHAQPEPDIKRLLGRMFAGTGYRLRFAQDMDAWYKCHLALILPTGYVCYATDCDLSKTDRSQRRGVLDAAAEGFGLLSALGYPLQPNGFDTYFRPGPKRAIMSMLLWLMAKTPLGRLIASDHCSNAVAEMQALDAAFAALRERAPQYSMPVWDALKNKTPGWEKLHRQYADRDRETAGKTQHGATINE